MVLVLCLFIFFIVFCRKENEEEVKESDKLQAVKCNFLSGERQQSVLPSEHLRQETKIKLRQSRLLQDIRPEIQLQLSGRDWTGVLQQADKVRHSGESGVILNQFQVSEKPEQLRRV